MFIADDAIRVAALSILTTTAESKHKGSLCEVVIDAQRAIVIVLHSPICFVWTNFAH